VSSIATGRSRKEELTGAVGPTGQPLMSTANEGDRIGLTVRRGLAQKAANETPHPRGEMRDLVASRAG